MGLQLTDRQRKIYKEFISDPLAKEISRTHDLGCEMTIKVSKVKNVNDNTHFTEQEYLEKEYCEITKSDLSNELSESLNNLSDKFDRLGFYNHVLSPNEFEYVLNEAENILNKEKEKNDNIIVRMKNWLERADNYINLIESEQEKKLMEIL